ncbi:MAG: NTP transferase domain-containing protein [Candidatus Tectimicrobiota bacterium]
MRIVGVLLAAGESRRMGRLKALLPFGAQTVIEHVLQPLVQADLAEVAVVLGHRAPEIAAVLQPWPVRVLYNPHYHQGMTTSVQVALRALSPLPDAYLLALVDQPHVRLQLVQQLLATFASTRKGLIIPTYAGKRGHPILLAATYREAILALGPDQGLNTVTRGYPEDTLEVPVSDDDILRDMDYPDEYEAALQRLQARQQTGE